MQLDDFAEKFAARMAEVKKFVEGDDIKDIIGVEAVNHFQQSFANEGFTDKQVVKWADVKRRDPNSKWYGHSGQTGMVSEAAKTRKILTGETHELRESISYVHIDRGVKVSNATPYAAVHQFGRMAKIYGKKEFTMTPRPFMGKSVLMVGKINDKIKREIKNILST